MSTRFQNVLDVIENYKSAVYELDVEKFLSAYASDVHLYDCWDSWESVGISPWKEVVTEWFQDLQAEGVLLKVEFADLAVEENSDLAFVYSKVTFAAYSTSGEKLRQLTNRFTFGLRKENESWIITHEHSSLPISKETGKGVFQPN